MLVRLRCAAGQASLGRPQAAVLFDNRIGKRRFVESWHWKLPGRHVVEAAQAEASTD